MGLTDVTTTTRIHNNKTQFKVRKTVEMFVTNLNFV